MPIYFFQRFWVFKPDKDVRIRRVGAVGGDVRCESGSGLMRKGQRFTLTLVTKSLVYSLHGVLDSHGGVQGEEETGHIEY